MRARGTLGALIAGALVGASLLAVAPAAPAAALSGSDFNPGLIITDGLFYDANAMSEADIQQFLVNKGSGLANMVFSVSSRARLVSESTGNLRCDAFTGGTLAASTIIFRAQQSCGISAKVLLVTLQKEQGLITTGSPDQTALDRAMGYACPDTAPCAPTTLGFGNQVYSGALQLNTYRASQFARQPGWQDVQFNPDTGCGSTQVYVQNYATAALYNYTPYQPNAAALANLGGAGDYCSSYGNRNFWTFYSNWFGSTYGTTAPFPIVAPSVVGSPTIGSTMSARTGAWAGSPSYAFSWLVCTTRVDTPFDTAPSGCSTIDGATAATYVSTADQAGKFLAVLVSATNSYGTTVAGGMAASAVGSPANLTPPTVTGVPTLGSTWSINTGTWAGVPYPTILTFWLRCNDPQAAVFTTVPAGCTAISGATSSTYTSTSADLGKYITAQVAGNSTLGFALAGAISKTPVGFPYNAALPTVTGAPGVGSTWTLDTGTWTGSPAPTLAIFWLRCNQPIATSFTTVPAGCSAISGANSTSYTSTSADVGKYLTAQVAGNSSRGFALAGALNSTAVQMTVPANTVAPTVSGAAPVGSTWTLNTGTWTGAPTPVLAIYWLRCTDPVVNVFSSVPAGCVAISGANATTYTSGSNDVGKYLTAQVAGNNAAGFGLAGAISTSSIQGSAPTNTVPPTVSGTATVGSTWTVNTGTWTGSPSIAIYWLRCSSPISSTFTAVPAGCVAISGANATTYVASSADAGKYLTAQVAGNGTAGFGLAGAISTSSIQGSAPTNTVPPTVSGTATVGSTWTVNTGTWTGSPSIAIYWLRCSSPISSTFTAVPAGCVAISGANATTYVASSADAGKYLTAQVAGNGTAGFALAGAISTTVIQSATPTNTAPPTISGTPAVGSVLTVDTGTWTGSPTIAIYWLRCTSPISSAFTSVPAGCTAISGANATTYTLVSADLGKYVAAQVAGNAPAGFALAGASSTGAVQAAVPTNTAPPTVSGAATIGSTWTVNTGTWTGSPTIAIYWLRCSTPITATFTTVPSGCVAITGANATTYVSTSADRGKYLTAQVAGNAPAGFALAGAVSTSALDN